MAPDSENDALEISEERRRSIQEEVHRSNGNVKEGAKKMYEVLTGQSWPKPATQRED